jgi:hypothetical protein
MPNRVVKIQGTIQERQEVPEYTVGVARKEIVYPGLAQCISITAYDQGRLIGTHISPGSTEEELEEHFTLLKEASENRVLTWYVAGQFENHFKTPKAILSSRDVLERTVQDKLGRQSTYYMFDTSLVAQEIGGFGIDLLASIVNVQLKFGIAKAFGPKKKTFRNIALWFFTRI